MVMFGAVMSTVIVLVSLMPVLFDPSVQLTYQLFMPSGMLFAVSVVLISLVTEPLLA